MTRFDREPLAGFVSPQTYLQPSGIELLSVNGTVSTVPYEEVKVVCFVRDFEQGEPRRDFRTFSSRPKMEGLWVRMRFRDGDWMDGLLPNNLLQMEAAGFMLIPPDPGYQNQRVFVPKAALTEMQVLGVVGTPLRLKKPKPVVREQIGLFGES